MSTAAVPQDPGKIRGLQRVTTEAGFFEICALDHLSDFAELLTASRDATMPSRRARNSMPG
jgi:hypothetical protein